MQFSDSDLEALRSLIKDERDALLDLDQKINDRRLDLHRLIMREYVFGDDELNVRDEEALQELPPRIKELEKQRKPHIIRLEQLRAEMPTGK